MARHDCFPVKVCKYDCAGLQVRTNPVVSKCVLLSSSLHVILLSHVSEWMIFFCMSAPINNNHRLPENLIIWDSEIVDDVSSVYIPNTAINP